MTKSTQQAGLMMKSLSIQQQTGMATLVFSLVILFTLTLTTIFGARVGLLDEKMSSNNFRAKQSMAAAEAGMDAAIMQIGVDGDVSGSPYTGVVDESVSGVYVTYSVTATIIDTTPVTIIEVVSTGCVGAHTSNTACAGSIESTSEITQQMARISAIGSAPASPMVLAGTLDPTGSYQLVGKEGGTIECGTGKLSDPDANECSGLLSVWSSDTVSSFSGSAATCYFDDFIYSYNDDGIDDVYGWDSDVPLCATTSVTSPLGASSNCYCWNGPTGKGSVGPYIARTDNMGASITVADKVSIDIVAPPVVDTPVTNFPTDLFAYVFNGTPRASSDTIKSALLTMIDPADGLPRQRANCASIDQDSGGMYWITGACDLASVVGSPESPVVMVIENNEVRTGGTEGFGLLFAFDKAGTGTATYKATGTSFWYGGIIVDGNGTVSAGATRLIYSEGVFDAINSDASLVTLSVIPGSWRDF